MVFSLISTLVVLVGLSGFLSWILNSIVFGVVTKTASDHIETGTSSLGASFNYTLSGLPSLLAAKLVSGLLIVAGLILFIVPGIFIAIMFSLVIPTVVIEQKGAFESLGRSKRLVSKRWGNTFLVTLVVALIVGIPMGVVNGVASVFSAADPVIVLVVRQVFNAFLCSIFPIALTCLYYSMVARETSSQPPIY